MRRIWIVVVALVTLSACAPVAEVIADTIERSDGATLAYGPQSLVFDPGDSTALGVIVRADGVDLSLLSVPDGAECEVTSTTLDCRLGDVESVTTIGLTGGGVIANATWRRAHSNAVFLTHAEVPAP